MVGGEGERGVVQRAVLLGDEHRLAAHLDHQRLGGRAERVRRGHPEADALDPVHVVLAAGERHHRVQRQRQRPGPGGGVEHADPVRAARVRDQPPGVGRAGRGQPLDQAGKHVVGNGEQHQVGCLEHAAPGR